MGQAAKKAPPTEFIDVLMRQGNGATNQELSDELREIVQRVRATGKTGTLTLQLKVELVKSTNSIVILDKISAKKPEYDRPSSLFFADDDGNLLREDPNQLSMFDLADIAEPGTTIVDLDDRRTVAVDPDSGEIKD